MIKRLPLVGLGTITALAVATFAGQPVMASLYEASQTIAQSIQREAPIQLSLTAAKRVKQNDQFAWQASGTSVTARPGDVLRYTLASKNRGERPVDNLVLQQPIPKGMTYVLRSTMSPSAKVTYSIDGGKSFVAQPMIKVRLSNGKVVTKPAPAESYTNIRWQLNQPVASGATAQVSYQVTVR